MNIRATAQGTLSGSLLTKPSKGKAAGKEGEVLGFPIWVCFSAGISLHSQATGVTPLNLENIFCPKLSKDKSVSYLNTREKG